MQDNGLKRNYSLYNNDISEIEPYKQPGFILPEKIQKYSPLYDYIDRQINFVREQSTDRKSIQYTLNVFKASNKQVEDKEISLPLSPYLKSRHWEQIKEQIFIAMEECQKYIASVVFRYLYQSKLTLRECQILYCKNMHINIKQITNQALATIKNSMYLKQEAIQEFSEYLVNTMDGFLSQILKQSALYYQIPTSVSFTYKMQEAAIPINRTSSQLNDVVTSQDIKISKYSKQQNEFETISETKYSDFIMEVLNSSLTFLNQKPSPASPENIYDKFMQLNERLQNASLNRPFRKWVNQIYRNRNHQLQPDLISIFMEVLDDEHQTSTGNQNIQPITSSIKQLEQKHERMKCSKIPSHQLTYNSLPVKLSDTSSLIIMQEWITNLQQIFTNPQKHIMTTPRFININNEQVQVNKRSQRSLISKIKSQKLLMQQKIGQITQQVQYLRRYLLKNSQNSQYKSKIANLPNVSADAMSGLMRSYLSTLIYHLLRAGSNLQAGMDKEDINLVSFKPTSLLTSKISCNQASFISILNTVNVLDRCNSSNRKFKLIKVSTALDEGENSFTIKYQLYDKVECCLVICLFDDNEKISHYYNFSQFLRKISKFKFGVIISCAMLISQNQPRCRTRTNQQNTLKKQVKFKERDSDKINEERSQRIHEKNSILYICKNCRNLVVNDTERSSQIFCNKCTIINRYQQAFAFVSNLINLPKGSKKLKRIVSEEDLTAKSYVIGCRLKQNRIIMYRTGFNEISLKYQLNPIDQKLHRINGMGKQQFKNKSSFIFQGKHINNLDQIYFILKIKKITEILPFSEFSQGKIKQFQAQVKDIQRVNEVKMMIELEKETIYLKEDNKKYQLFINNLQDEEIKNDGKKKMGNFKRNAKRLSLASLKLKEIDIYFKEMINLVQIDLKQNKLTKINLSAFPKLTLLNLSDNQLTSIDLKQNTQLVNLELSMNQITTIDLTKNINIENLDISHNHLKQINFDKNQKLLRIILNNNQISQSVFNKNTLLKDLDLSHNCLTRHIVLKNQKIQRLLLNYNDVKQVSITKLKNLTFLNICDMQIQKIDLSANTKLTFLLAENNNLSYIDLSSNISLTKLKLSQNKLETINIKENKNLTELQLHQNYLGSIDLSNNKMLIKLDLRKNKLYQTKLQDNVKLRDLNLSANKQIKNIDLSFSTDLEQLSMHGNSLQTIDLTNNKKLDVIDVRSNNLALINIVYTPKLQPRNIKLTQISSYCHVMIHCLQKEKEKCNQFKDTLNELYPQYTIDIVIN